MLIEICVYEIEAPGQYQHFGNVLRHSLFTSMDKEEKGAQRCKVNLGRSQCQAAPWKRSGSRYPARRKKYPLQAPAAATEDLSTANTT
jgi:hypothetical protein